MQQQSRKFTFGRTPYAPVTNQMLPYNRPLKSTHFLQRDAPQIQDNQQLERFDSAVTASVTPDVPAAAQPQAQAPQETIDAISTSKRFLSGTPDMLLKWFTMMTSPAVYEVISQLVNIHVGKDSHQKIFILRGSRGPVLKVSYFKNDHVHLTSFDLGTWIRCVGTMQDSTTLRAFSIRDATPKEVSALPRVSYLCEQEVSLCTSSEI